MTSYSVLLPFLPRRPEQILPYAGLVHWSNASRLWQGQSVMIEPHQGFVAAAGAGFRVPTGLGVTLMPLRHPYEAALQARSLAMATGQPVTAGFGPGGRPLQRSLLGEPYRSPLTAAREYLSIVRGLLAGDGVDVRGEYFSCRAEMPRYPAPNVEIGLGVLRPGMARLAGEVADVAVTWLTPAHYLRDTVLPAMREGAGDNGRGTPRLTAIVPLALARPDREPAELALASNAAHLQGAHYIDMLRRSGTDVAGDDPAANAKALVDGGAFLSGDPDELVAKLGAFRDAGVDEVVLNLTGVCNLYGPQAALDETKRILAALAA
ncbi:MULTISPECIES: LLM class flavin-dependent oxidoreductase [Streptomyces]|uniref:LLM class flavin-dependent oxidoreductase n=1 Tax=Streptomyces scabiei TaxID=1930 RepID=UPI0004E63842|nr:MULTISPECIES: LLM class flavin-dependent oxidoreductase [Streptomyces]MBP5868321.1 LLM class flavin-dependent oxidoreductase [Streptomyces sp. LBUM 1485]MBP5906907.1 LLM class flavin-dependent oxidoreductase [Streptomyces sp. LBUM 1478]MBP5930360.1 LLM class flavin-dependent oxidoreductase [Streptomyces sp. LBUM 1479]KFG07399.1 5,10-methylene tetrahydromethanopterin reductase [Streptomyces scabiei]MBP5915802.1 LLM class flavin-dependent oxidoreductase [Streptomyces sp. LBUM 1486]